MRYDLWQGDLDPPIGLTLTGVTSIVGATCEFVMAQVNGSFRIQAPAVIDDPLLRKVHYQWLPGDTNVPGIYRAVFRCIYPGQMPETFPSDEPIFIVIHAAI